tara:strand:- start:36385 stop:36783 length:399 start_codon:yes stop_codon:yes gene_type:complete
MFLQRNKDKPKLSKNQSTKAIGDLGENLALCYLQSKGLKLVEKQYRCRFGECDIIMRENNILVFVEVRYKKNSRFCLPEETIHYKKQQRLIKTAECFLFNYPTSDCRMDVVSIVGQEPNFKITWIPDAFGVQ